MIGQFFGQEILKKLTRTGNTSVQFQAGSRLRLGGLGAILESALNLNTGTSGLGGIDVGSIAANNYYYVYAVISGTTVGLIASLSSLAPTGFLAYRKIGAFNTEQLSTNVEQVMSFDEQPDSELYVRTAGGFGSTNTSFARFSVAENIKGLEVEWQPSATLGDKFQCGIAGHYKGQLGFVDLQGSQEAGVSINSDAFGTTFFGTVMVNNPELRFISGRSHPTSNLPENLTGGRLLNQDDYLRVHTHGASVFANGSNEAFFIISKKGSNEIDWTL